MFDDEARFDRQRRNVVVLSSAVLFAYTFGIDLTKLTDISATGMTTAKAAAASLILCVYFFFRFYQMSDMPEERQRIYQLYGYIVEQRLLASFGSRVKEEAEAKANTAMGIKGVTDYKKSLMHGALQYKHTSMEKTYVLKLEESWAIFVNFGQESELIQGTTSVNYLVDSEEFRSITKKAILESAIHTKLLTEHVLPYLLALSAIACLTNQITKTLWPTPHYVALAVAATATIAAALVPISAIRRLPIGKKGFNSFAP
jgi:hypothetical protein